MSKLARNETRRQAALPETRQPELRLVEGGRPQPSESYERRMRRERRRARNAYQPATGWRIRAW